MLEGEPFEEILAQSSLETSQPAEVGQVGKHHLEFHLLVQDVAPGSQGGGVGKGKARGLGTHGLVQVLLSEQGGPTASAV